MEAGGSHPMPHFRHLLKVLVALLAYGVLTAVPASAAAAVPLPSVPGSAGAALDSVETTVATATPLVQKAAEQAAAVVRPGTGSHSPAPASQGPIAGATQAVTPVAAAAAQAVPAPSSAQARTRHHKRARAELVRAAASSHADRLSAGPTAHRGRSTGVSELPAVESRAVGHGAAPVAGSTPRADFSAGAATPSETAPERGSGFTAGAAASGASASFFFGGGLALIVVAFLLAGPDLRRLLSLSPAVCRPAAFVAVLERPG
jgi:hypothetical protein